MMFHECMNQECGPLEERGMVMGVLHKAFDVLVLKLGVIQRVYCDVSSLAWVFYDDLILF